MKKPFGKNIESLQKSKYLQLLPDFKEDKVQKFTTLTLTIITLAFFTLFAINPTISTIGKLQKELEDNKYVDEQLETKINNLSVLEEKYNQIQNDLPIILSSVPNKPDIPILIAEIESVAKNSGVNILSLQSFEVETESGKAVVKAPTSFSFSLSAEGSKENISLFTSEITSMRRITTPDLISLNIDKETDGTLKVSIKGKAYFKK